MIRLFTKAPVLRTQLSKVRNLTDPSQLPCNNPQEPICPKQFAAFVSGCLTGYCLNLVVYR
jgi:hypothetical protein